MISRTVIDAVSNKLPQVLPSNQSLVEKLIECTLNASLNNVDDVIGLVYLYSMTFENLKDVINFKTVDSVNVDLAQNFFLYQIAMSSTAYTKEQKIMFLAKLEQLKKIDERLNIPTDTQTSLTKINEMSLVSFHQMSLSRYVAISHMCEELFQNELDNLNNHFSSDQLETDRSAKPINLSTARLEENESSLTVSRVYEATLASHIKAVKAYKDEKSHGTKKDEAIEKCLKKLEDKDTTLLAKQKLQNFYAVLRAEKDTIGDRRDNAFMTFIKVLGVAAVSIVTFGAGGYYAYSNWLGKFATGGRILEAKIEHQAKRSGLLKSL